MHYQVYKPDDYTDGDDHCKDCEINVQLVYTGGYTWLGIGLSNGGKMVGSHAIIGQPGISSPKSYLFDGKDIDAIELTDSTITNPTIDFEENECIMEFTISFADWGAPVKSGPGISLTDSTTFIFAHGSNGDAKLQYHGPNGKGSKTINNLLVSTEHSDLFSSTSMQQSKKKMSNKSAWLAHGILAFIAWGLLAPTAITTAIMRDIEIPDRFMKVKLYLSKLKEKWLFVHITLNTLACVITMLVFIVAVLNVNHENGYHWLYAHNKMGLAMFILSFNQVLGGYLRPSSHPQSPEDTNSTESEENGMNNENNTGEEDDGRQKIMPVKSTIRQLWELLHNVLGIALFLFGVWQLFEGMELYHMRYNNSSAGFVFGLYIIFMAIWICLIIGGSVYKWYRQTQIFKKDVPSSEHGSDLSDPSDVQVELHEVS